MASQLSKKAALPLAKILATCRNNVSNTGPSFGSVKCLLPIWCQAITWANPNLLSWTLSNKNSVKFEWKFNTFYSQNWKILLAKCHSHGLTLIPEWISNHTPNWGVKLLIHSPFPNWNGITIGVWEWITNLIPHFIMDVIFCPYWE